MVFFTLQQQLRSIIDCRLSLFAQCLAVRAKQANQMLAKGYKQSSRFGRWDPVLVGCYLIGILYFYIDYLINLLFGTRKEYLNYSFNIF